MINQFHIHKKLLFLTAALACLFIAGCTKDESGQQIGVEVMLHELLAPYKIPVLCGFPAGHGDVNLPLVMGAPVTIDVNSSGATLSFGIDGQQKEVTTENVTVMKSSTEVRIRLAGKRD